MLDALGTIFVATTIAAVIGGIAAALPRERSRGILPPALAGAWVGFAAAMAGAGALDNPLTLGAMFAAPLAVAAGMVIVSPIARTAVAGLPIELLVRLNVFRVGGVLFLLLAVSGRWPDRFPISRVGAMS